MKQQAHGYIAARATALLEADPETRPFAKLLLPHLGQAAVGAWLPDHKLFKNGVGDTQNHGSASAFWVSQAVSSRNSTDTFTAPSGAL